MIETPDGLIKPEVQFTGNDGNAMSIMANCSRELRRAGNSSEIVDAYMKESMSGNYDHVLQTAMAYCEVN